jgi:hypothetical protein
MSLVTESLAEQVYNFLLAKMLSTAIPMSHWYVGIASDPEDRLFNEHNVNKESKTWAYMNAGRYEVACKLAQFIIEQHQTRGCSGVDDQSATFVYVYAITDDTVQWDSGLF